jgi:pSer/pThr/pTyr-binding forkhead associated (FHA) protein
MTTLILQLEDQVVKKCAVGPIATIGRLPDNTVVIDNPAVSGHHACVFPEGDQLVLEDLQSTNGTFVNGSRVSRHVLQHGDVVLVGKHTLVLDQLVSEEPPVPDGGELSAPNLGETVFLDTRKLLDKLLMDPEAYRKYEALRATLSDVENDASRTKRATAEAAAEPAKVGVLRVLGGRADQSEYDLEGHTSLIGKQKSSLVRLHGWFKPNVAVAITRNRQAYVATLLGGDMLINNHPVRGRCELKDGDVLEVSGLTLSFCLNG